MWTGGRGARQSKLFATRSTSSACGLDNSLDNKLFLAHVACFLGGIETLGKHACSQCGGPLPFGCKKGWDAIFFCLAKCQKLGVAPMGHHPLPAPPKKAQPGGLGCVEKKSRKSIKNWTISNTVPQPLSPAPEHPPLASQCAWRAPPPHHSKQ